MCSPSFMQIVFVLCIWVFKCLTLFSEGIVLKTKTKSSKTKIPFNKVIFHTLATHNTNLRQELGQKKTFKWNIYIFLHEFKIAGG